MTDEDKLFDGCCDEGSDDELSGTEASESEDIADDDIPRPVTSRVEDRELIIQMQKQNEEYESLLTLYEQEIRRLRSEITQEITQEASLSARFGEFTTE